MNLKTRRHCTCRKCDNQGDRARPKPSELPGRRRRFRKDQIDWVLPNIRPPYRDVAKGLIINNRASSIKGCRAISQRESASRSTEGRQ